MYDVGAVSALANPGDAPRTTRPIPPPRRLSCTLLRSPPPPPAPRPQTKGRTVVFGTACAAVVLIGGYIPVYACQFQQRKAGA